VSTSLDRQNLGSDAQVASIEEWSRKNDVRIVEWLVEEVSGGAELARRPVLLQALGATVAHGAGVLVVQKIDRFSRDGVTAALALGELERNGATLAVADGAGGGEDPTAQLIRAVLLAVAQFEKAMIAVRVRSALQVKKTRGEMTGVAPYGTRLSSDGKTLEPHPEESAIKERLRQLRTSGLTIRAIIRQANVEGLCNRKGKPFTLRSLHVIVKDVA
jgi:DNA invertase Pin-like site-specific DNA recombinase